MANRPFSDVRRSIGGALPVNHLGFWADLRRRAINALPGSGGEPPLHYRHHLATTLYVGGNRLLVRLTMGDCDLAFFLQADDRLIAPWFALTGNYEVGPTRYFYNRIRSDSHCVDVGANFGYFTCLMAKLCPQGKVVGIEADASNAALVNDNILLNTLQDNASVVHAAASAATGETLTLYRRPFRSGNTSVAAMGRDFTDRMGEPPEEPFTVPTLRVDDLLDQMQGRIDFLKIDVEGAEPLAVRGAAQTIATNPQLQLIMEWSPGQIRSAGFDIGALLAELTGHGLMPWRIAGRSMRALSIDDVSNLPYNAGLIWRRS